MPNRFLRKSIFLSIRGMSITVALIAASIIFACSGSMTGISSKMFVRLDPFYGVEVGNDANASEIISVLQDLKISTVRLWANVNWNERREPSSGVFDRARRLKQAGFKVIVLFQNREVPSSATEVKAYFDWVQTLPGIRESIDIWEILNELEGRKYWLGTGRQYVQLVLKPAWESLHSQREKVLGGSFSAWQETGWNTNITQEYLTAGYLNYVDYAGSHPYTFTVEQMKWHLNQVKQLYGSKPIIITEWNFLPQARADHGRDYQKWRQMLDEVLPYVKGQVLTICYFRLHHLHSEGGWPGLIDYENRPVNPFYEMYRSWTRSV
ncbi:glycoside hydrolase family protein [Synechococcus sp. Nb3U1]|uniref:glycosyl hydrolase n=1 Tax=Synechococcus sp. Nb3U1 TaxID=1914529 RepID=UPI001F4834D8|nr:glycosyl hydrolase [Synechococcus sp. Nb3U1]MCF2970784.1 glycoside hydrolase family protein [Synechococcus sp. Nb3U1]